MSFATEKNLVQNVTAAFTALIESDLDKGNFHDNRTRFISTVGYLVSGSSKEIQASVRKYTNNEWGPEVRSTDLETEIMTNSDNDPVAYHIDIIARLALYDFSIEPILSVLMADIIHIDEELVPVAKHYGVRYYPRFHHFE
jgi:hypothetical protein